MSKEPNVLIGGYILHLQLTLYIQSSKIDFFHQYFDFFFSLSLFFFFKIEKGKKEGRLLSSTVIVQGNNATGNPRL